MQSPIDAVPFQVWTLPDGAAVTEFFRRGPACLLRFPAYADFEVGADERVECWPTPGTSEGTIQHLYLNQVLPLAQSRRGALIFHASAVVLAGAAVAFMGRSGQGKSTMAASFALEGHAYIADDATRVERGQQGSWEVPPSQRSMRLWLDSREALDTGTLPEAPAVQFTTKARLLPGSRIAFAEGSHPLGCIYQLGDNRSAPAFEPLSPAAALVALLSNSFLLDSDLRESVATHFDRLTAFVDTAPVYRLHYPRDFDALPEVRAAIVQHVQAHR